MKHRLYHFTIVGYITLIALNLLIIDQPQNMAKELLPIWVPWIAIWATVALSAFWLHTATITRRPAIKYLFPILYAVLTISWAATADGQDWLATIIPLNSLIILTITSAIHAYKITVPQPEPLARNV